MSRGAPRRDESTVSLFPFLAVLICTMGALIVLLVVLVQQASVPDAVPQTAEAVESSPQLARVEAPAPVVAELPAGEAEEADGPTLETLELQIADSQWRSEMLEESREEALRRLREHQLTLSRVEDRARALAERLEKLQAEARRIAVAADSESAETERASEQLERLQTSMAEAMQQLERARREAAENRQLYAIVPYDGPNGTERRPIYVECLGNRVILHPEGVELGSEDFTDPMGPDNALAQSLRAVREYLLDAEVTESAIDPYPLLIVRPDGARAYAACRRALHGWDDEFGYELVPADIKLKYPAPDPALALILQEVVEQARQRNRFIARQPSRTRTGVLLSADPRTGGFVTQNGESAGDYASSSSRDGAQGGSHDGAQGGSRDGAQGGSRDGAQGGSAASAQAGGGRGGGGPSALNGMVPPPDSAYGNGTPNASTWGPPNAQPTQPPPSLYGTAIVGNPSDGASFGQTGTGPNVYGAGNSDAGASSGPGDSGEGGDSVYGSTGSADFGGASGGSATQNGGSTGASVGASGTGRGSTGTQGTAGQSSMRSTSAASQREGAAGNFSLPAPNNGQPSGSTAVAFGGGRNWGLPNATDGAIGITRPVYIRCTPDALVLRSSNGSSQAIPFDGATQSAIRPFVTQLWNHIESWGIAGSGCYWKPILKVDVGSGGEARFAEFASLLQNSGLEVVRR